MNTRLAAVLLAFHVTLLSTEALGQNRQESVRALGYFNGQTVLQAVPGAAAARTTLEREAEAARQELERTAEALRAQKAEYLESVLAARQRQLLQPIRDEVYSVVEAVRRESGLTDMIDVSEVGVLAADPSLDLTSHIAAVLSARAQHLPTPRHTITTASSTKFASASSSALWNGAPGIAEARRDVEAARASGEPDRESGIFAPIISIITAALNDLLRSAGFGMIFDADGPNMPPFVTKDVTAEALSRVTQATYARGHAPSMSSEPSPSVSASAKTSQPPSATVPAPSPTVPATGHATPLPTASCGGNEWGPARFVKSDKAVQYRMTLDGKNNGLHYIRICFFVNKSDPINNCAQLGPSCEGWYMNVQYPEGPAWDMTKSAFVKFDRSFDGNFIVGPLALPLGSSPADDTYWDPAANQVMGRVFEGGPVAVFPFWIACVDRALANVQHECAAEVGGQAPQVIR